MQKRAVPYKSFATDEVQGMVCSPRASKPPRRPCGPFGAGARPVTIAIPEQKPISHPDPDFAASVDVEQVVNG